MDNKEKWFELYDLAQKVYELKPWEKLWDSYLFVYCDKKGDVYYICTMGKADIHKGVNIYKNEQIYSYLEMSKAIYPAYLMINYQNCISVEFISKEEVIPDNLKIIEKLGLKFKNDYISFEKFEEGFYPRIINTNDIEQTIEVLKNYIEMLKEYDSYNIDFEKGEIFIRKYDDKKYINDISMIFFPKKTVNTLKVSSEIKKKLSGIKEGKFKIEYDFLSYIPLGLKDSIDSNGIQYFPRIRFIVQSKTNNILKGELIDKNEYDSEEEYVKESIDILIDCIKKHGKPKIIYVRDSRAFNYLKDFSEKTGIKIKVKPSLDSLDLAMGHFLDSFSHNS